MRAGVFRYRSTFFRARRSRIVHAPVTVSSVTITPTGGIAFGGVATLEKGAIITPSGGFVFGGTAPRLWERTVTPSGGIDWSGVAPVETHEASRTIVPTGGIVWAGVATIARQSLGAAKSFIQLFRRRRKAP